MKNRSRMRLIVDPNTGDTAIENAPLLPNEDDIDDMEVVSMDTLDDAVAALARKMGARHTRLK